MKTVPKRLYVFLALNVTLITITGLLVSASIHTPEMFKDPVTTQKSIKADKFVFVTKENYASYSEVQSDQDALDEYAEKYRDDMLKKQNDENAVMPDFDRQYKKYGKIKQHLEDEAAKFEPSEEEKQKEDFTCEADTAGEGISSGSGIITSDGAYITDSI